MGKRKVILRNFLSPGDLVMLTAAVRDLHRCYPRQFITDVRSSCPELWEHNPHLTPLRESDAGVEQIDCHYPLIDRSNEAPYHCIHGFTEFLNERLDLRMRPTFFAGDIHLSDEERRWKSTVHELGGRDIPFWIINAGGKFDFTIKWWDWRRYQRIVDHFRGKILFVQVGEIGHYHPPLKNVVDLRGRTDLRQLVRLVYHSQGVLCGVTALMHLAAAVPMRPDRSLSRAAVIIAGGREPTHWEAYPHHQFIHTIGALKCCAVGGCWRARTRPLGDGEVGDDPANLCSNVVGDLPRCMDMITVEEVIRRIETYFVGGANRYLSPPDIQAAERAIAKSLEGPRLETTINLLTMPAAFHRAARQADRKNVPSMEGSGVLLFTTDAAEAAKVIASARCVRAHDSAVPIECWSAVEFTRGTSATLRAMGVVLHVAPRPEHDGTSLTQAELRLHALLHSNLRHVNVMEPGVQLRISPQKLFGWRAYREAGVVFPRAVSKANVRPAVWKLCGLPVPSHTAGTECFVMDRFRCWKALLLWRWMIERMYFFKGYVDGGGGAAQLAFAEARLRIPLSLNSRAFLVPVH